MEVNSENCMCEVNGRQCKLRKKYPENDPKYCYHHKTCTKPFRGQVKPEVKSQKDIELEQYIKQKQIQKTEKFKHQEAEKHKLQLEQRKDLIEFIDQHMLPSNVEDKETIPREIRRDNVVLKFVPALQQSRSDKSQSNFCAYYALYNALSLLGHQIDDIKNRKKFIETVFIPTLIRVKYIRKKLPYDNLTSAELREIIKGFDNIAIVERSCLSLYGMGIFESFDDAFDGDIKSAKLVEDFISKKTNKIAVIELLASPEAKVGGHWITIMGERIGEQLFFNVTDSLHPIEWYMSNMDMINTRVVPVYYALTGQWNQLVQEFGQLGGRKKRLY